MIGPRRRRRESDLSFRLARVAGFSHGEVALFLGMAAPAATATAPSASPRRRLAADLGNLAFGNLAFGNLGDLLCGLVQQLLVDRLAALGRGSGS